MTLLTDLCNATTQRECDLIIEKNIHNVDAKNRTFFCLAANRAKRRINRLNREKKKSWSDLIN